MRRIPFVVASLVAGAVAVSSVGRDVAAGDAPPSRVLSIADFRELRWDVAPTLSLRDKLELPMIGSPGMSIEAPKDVKIAVVDLTLHVPPAMVGAKDLPFEPARFLLRHAGAIAGAKAAGIDNGTGATGIVWGLANATDSLLVHLVKPTIKASAAFAVPKGWTDGEVLYAMPLGEAKVAVPPPK